MLVTEATCGWARAGSGAGGAGWGGPELDMLLLCRKALTGGPTPRGWRFCPCGVAHCQSAQSCLGETLSALSYSNKLLESGPAPQLSYTGLGKLTPLFYFNLSLSMPPVLESWFLE